MDDIEPVAPRHSPENASPSYDAPRPAQERVLYSSPEAHLDSGRRTAIGMVLIASSMVVLGGAGAAVFRPDMDLLSFGAGVGTGVLVGLALIVAVLIRQKRRAERRNAGGAR